MEQHDLEMLDWAVRRKFNELLEYVKSCSSALHRLSKIDEYLETLDPKHIADFYFLADSLIAVWIDHPQGQALRGDLTPSTLTDVLDRNVLLSETSNNKE